MKNIISAVKGTRDFYPRDMAIRTWLYQAMREVSEAFGYQEYEGPILETLELYASKSGEELVKKQAFVFNDRGGDQITLRPELTPTLARMVAQKQGELVMPLRWWSFGPFWRYEQPQKGRTREFFQWNVDLIGVDTPEADAELLAVISAFFRKVGLSPNQAVILVNNRKLVDEQLTKLGISSEMKVNVSNLIDRRDKMKPDEWAAYALELGLTQPQVDGLIELLADQELWRQSEELVRLFDACKALGMQEYVRFDPNVVRGLLYYTGTVFEAYSLVGEVRRAILGGGRYNNLLAAVGGEPLPATGFAMGDVVISLVLKSLGLSPAQAGASPAQVLVTIFNPDTQCASLSLSAELRQAGIRTACYPDSAKLPKQFKYADRVGIPLAIVMGPDEIEKQQVTIKNLKDGTQQSVTRGQAAALIKQILA